MHDMGYRKQADRKWKQRYNTKTNIESFVLDSSVEETSLHEMLEPLSERQRMIVNMKIENHTQEVIGTRLGKSRSWVCGELKKIKHILEKNNGNTG
jgi:DNA-directed RNA polymerase specialized sigma subunit